MADDLGLAAFDAAVAGAPDPGLAAFEAAVAAPPVRRRGPKRYPGDPISGIEERKAHPPPNARGSAPAETSAWDFPLAVVKGVAHAAGLPTEIPKTPAEALSAASAFLPPNPYSEAQQAVQMVKGATEAYRRSRAATTTARKAQAAVSGVPVISPLADVAEPGIAYSEGRAPTHEENVAAVEGGATLATLVATPKLLRVANVLRARGVPVESATAEIPESGVGIDHGPVAPPEPATPTGAEAADISDADILADFDQRRGGLSVSEFFKKEVEANHYRRSPEAAIARESLPLEEFVKQRFPRATLTPERDAAWTQSILSETPEGAPGFAIEPAPAALKAEGVDRQLVYRDPDGKPIGVANIVDGEAGDAPLVRDLAVDKSQGLLAGRAVGAIAGELDRAGAFEHTKEISPDAARFIQKAEARRAAATSTKGGPPKPSGGQGGNTPPSQPPPTSPAGGTAPPPQPTPGSNTSGGAPPPPTIQRAASQPTPKPPALPSVDDPQYGAALRTRYTGSVDVRALEGNQIRTWMRETLTPDEQNALSLMRDEKSQPGITVSMLDGTNRIYHDNPTASHAHVEAMRDVAELALNPTPAMQAADGVLDAYFEKTLKEGKEAGVIDSSIEPSDYIPHLLQPSEGIEPGRTGSPGGISETTPFALKRKNPTILEAMARGLDPRTINAADAVSIYARRHGLAMGAQILEDTLKESGIGKSVTAGNAPEGWKEVGEGTRAFKRQIPYHDESGKFPDGSNHIAIANQALYAPEKIAEALRPITEPNYMLKVPGWEATQRFQDYIKSSNVALAFFHLKAVTITAFNSMRLGPVDMMRAYMIHVDDPFFVNAEQNLIMAGGKTSAVGQTAEAYRALEPTALPSRVDAIRNLPVMRQLDAAAAATSKLTFDIALRKTKVMDFASKDAAWIAKHPQATDVELAEARRSTARTLNANYGGLNWEALGITRTVHALMRAFMFAPDWTWSNAESVTQAFRNGPGGAQARWYMARSIAGGIGATAAMTYFMTGKTLDQVPGRMKDKLFNVYLGDDEKGNHKFMNLFFAGAPNDAVNLAANVVDYGIGKGVGMSIATKTNVLPRLGMHVATNKDFMGRDIVPPGAGPVLGTAISIRNAAGELAPVPFSVKNAAQMVTDSRREYSPAEYAAAMIAGVRPRHVVDHGDKIPLTITKWVDEPPKNSAWDILTGKPVYKGRK